MVVDSSAVVAILKSEPGARPLREAILNAERCVMSAPNMVETSIVVAAGRGEAGIEELDALVKELALHIVPFNSEHVILAREAFRHFGKGRHPAGLNFGDCLSYALAKHLAEPLLFTGDDFARTDVEPAIA